jgi:glyoxylate reductase
MTKSGILITRRLPGCATRQVIEAFGASRVEVHDSDEPISRADLLARVRGKDGLLCLLTERIDAELMDAAGNQLRIVSTMAVGYDNIDVPAATARGIAVTNTPGVLTESTADLAFALLLAAARRLGEAERFVRGGRWSTWSPTLLLGLDLAGATLGIFGMGRIGQAVARRAQGFGMRILYHNRHRLPEAEEASLRASYVDKNTLLAESDFLSLHCPLSAETRHAFSVAEFRRMKPTSVFVNTTRGPVVDEAALAQALREGWIFSAGIDVFEREPEVHPELLACENAVLIPHLGSATQATRARMAEMAAENLITLLQGGRPPHCVNPEVLV